MRVSPFDDAEFLLTFHLNRGNNSENPRVVCQLMDKTMEGIGIFLRNTNGVVFATFRRKEIVFEKIVL